MAVLALAFMHAPDEHLRCLPLFSAAAPAYQDTGTALVFYTGLIDHKDSCGFDLTRSTPT
jgi:hypothetical protein